MSYQHPPKWALSFLRWFCSEEYLDEIEGDIFEMYYLRSKHSVRSAKLFFVWNVLRSFRPINFKKTQFTNTRTMNLFRNYTKIYFRRFRKESSHYLVNIFGLAMGFTILFFILLFVHDEQNIDNYHSKGDRIYQVINVFTDEDGRFKYISSPGPLADALKAEFPAIEEVAHLTYTGSQIIRNGEVNLAERDWAMGTSSVFDILDFEIVSGNPKKSFNGNVGLVVTEGLAHKLFGHTDVVGEVVESGYGTTEILAVMKEMPKNSSYRFTNIYVANFDQFPKGWRRLIGSWRGRFAQTWVLLKEGKTPDDVLALKDDFLDKYVPEDFRENIDLELQSILDIHLGSSGIERGGMSPRMFIPQSDKQFVSMILLLGFLVIFIAALNYVNLSSVQALKRTLEASMRKINGANTRNLVIQLFYETFLTVLIAYAIANILMIVFFQEFLSIANKELSFSLLYSVDLMTYHFLIILVIWVISALLPALYYSRLKRSLLVLKNAFSGKGDLLRKILVGVQYALSIFLIIGSIVIYRQMNYIQSKDLGFDNKNLIVLDINSRVARQSFKEILNGVRNNANVISASTSTRVPGEWKNIPTVNILKSLSGNPIGVSHYGVDHHWLDTYNIALKSGDNFSGNDKTDSLSVLINDQTASLLEMDDPVGKYLWVLSSSDSVRMQIIGVVDDFHYESFYEPIGPILVTSWNNHVQPIDYFTIRYAQNPKEAVEHVESVHSSFDPQTPAEINFLDKQWKRFYKSEESRATIILIASVVSIVISAFGLFGLINFTVERKTKEIGIRKVLGASYGNITKLILRDYIVLLLIALIVATPVSWWLFEDWLSDFAYRIQLSLDLLFIAFVIVVIVSFTTALTRISRIAKANPVQSIRYE